MDPRHTPRATPIGRWAETLRIPPIESPFLEELLAHASLPPGWDEKVRQLHRDGYALLDLDIPDFDAIVERIDDDLSGKYGADRRVAEAWYWNQDVRDLACLPQVLDMLRLLYQREPIPFQTLNFEVGTEQPAHSDTIHFHSLPRHWMCGVWIAFEEITADSGPLVVYPGSHRLPDYEMHDLGVPSEPEAYPEYENFLAKVLAAEGFQPKHLVMKKGQAALWLANLIHGGSHRIDRERTRKSLVTHYYFPDCQYFFPMQSDLAVGRITRREVIDIRTGRFVPHRYDGKVVPLGDIRKVCTYPRPLPKWVEKPPK